MNRICFFKKLHKILCYPFAIVVVLFDFIQKYTQGIQSFKCPYLRAIYKI